MSFKILSRVNFTEIKKNQENWSTNLSKIIINFVDFFRVSIPDAMICNIPFSGMLFEYNS